MKSNLIVKPFPAPNNKPKRLPERKAVTIAAGFKCPDGIVLCADTQETFKNAKTSVPKLRMLPGYGGEDHSDDLVLAIAGAGDGPFIDKLVDSAWEKVKSATSFNEATALMQESIEETHRKFGEIFQPGYLPYAELIYSIKMDGQSGLYSATGPIVNERDKYGIHGSGYEIGNFISSQMLSVGSVPTLTQLTVLATYVVYQAKIHADGVGGDTHLAMLKNSGGSMGDFNIGEKWVEQHFKYLDVLFGPAFLSNVDIDTPDFIADAQLDTFVSMLKSARSDMKTERQRILDYTKKMRERMAERKKAYQPAKKDQP